MEAIVIEAQKLVENVLYEGMYVVLSPFLTQSSRRKIYRKGTMRILMLVLILPKGQPECPIMEWEYKERQREVLM